VLQRRETRHERVDDGGVAREDALVRGELAATAEVEREALCVDHLRARLRRDQRARRVIPDLLAVVRARRKAQVSWLGDKGIEFAAAALADALEAGTLVELPAPDAAVRRALTRRFWVVRLPERYRTAAVDALMALAVQGAGRRAGR
jgi:hypothetical protein